MYLAVIQRSDNGVWALPGGMIDNNEQSIDTAKREFIEEAGNVSDNDRNQFHSIIQQIYNTGYQGVIYQGYVDESRHTDNAWIETVAHHWHVPDELSNQLHLVSGDDATQVKWINIDDQNELDHLHGNHRDFVLRAKALFEQKQQHKK